MIRMAVWSAMIGVTLAAGWLLLDAETDRIMEAIWFFVAGTGLSFLVSMFGPAVMRPRRK